METNPIVPQASPNKLLYSAVGVLFLVVAIAVAWQVNKQTNQGNVSSSSQESVKGVDLNQISSGSTVSTTDWKTYTNAQYGFELNYPKDWLQTNNPSGVRFTSLDSAADSNNADSLYKASFSIHFAAGANPSGDLNQYKAEPQASAKNIKTNLKFSGKDAVRFDLDNSSTIIIGNGTDIILVSFPNQEAFNDTYNQILSTFMFTK